MDHSNPAGQKCSHGQCRHGMCLDHGPEWKNVGEKRREPNPGIFGKKTYWTSWHCGQPMARYKEVLVDHNLDGEKKMAETKRAIEEATALETPLLERNLIALSTIASVATMFGLLGTVIGMIRAFAALAAQGGAPDAIQLSIGISEALINTALGLFAAILGIIGYNFFVTKVDNFTYMIDEASYNVAEILSSKTK